MGARAGWAAFLGCMLSLAMAAAVPEGEKPAKKDSGTSKGKAEGKKKAAPEKGSEEPGTAEPAPGAEKPADGAEPEPQFKSPKGEEAYKNGKDLFDLEKYTEAAAEMKRARELAKTPADKSLVDRWSVACEGGKGLESYRRLAERGLLRRVLFPAMDSAERYRDSPLGPRLKTFVEDLRPKVLEVLESFDAPTPRFSEKFGKTFVSDPKIVFHGASCLLWASGKEGKDSQLRINTDAVPKKWGAFHSVVFWLRAERPVELHLMASTPARTKAGEDPSVMEATFTPPAQKSWVRAEIELEKFRKHGTASFSNVDGFLFQIEARTTFKFYIDDIALVRKDASELRGGADSESGDDKKGKKKQGKATSGKVKQTETKGKKKTDENE